MKPATEDPEPGECSNAMTVACLTVSQVQSIPWSAAPSSTWLLLVTSAVVTPIVTRVTGCKAICDRGCRSVSARLFPEERDGRKQVGKRLGCYQRFAARFGWAA